MRVTDWKQSLMVPQNFSLLPLPPNPGEYNIDYPQGNAGARPREKVYIPAAIPSTLAPAPSYIYAPSTDALELYPTLAPTVKISYSHKK